MSLNFFNYAAIKWEIQQVLSYGEMATLSSLVAKFITGKLLIQQCFPHKRMM